MEKITIEAIKAFIASNNIHLKPTQTKLCVPIITRICQKMSNGIKFDDIKVCNDLLIDGHHRYISSLIVKFDLGQVKSNTTSSTKSIEWDKIEFDEQDWDTSAKIAYLNELDAKYNNLDIEFIKQITLS
jgi:hypothetical protein